MPLKYLVVGCSKFKLQSYRPHSIHNTLSERGNCPWNTCHIHRSNQMQQKLYMQNTTDMDPSKLCVIISTWRWSSCKPVTNGTYRNPQNRSHIVCPIWKLYPAIMESQLIKIFINCQRTIFLSSIRLCHVSSTLWHINIILHLNDMWLFNLQTWTSIYLQYGAFQGVVDWPYYDPNPLRFIY